MKTAAVEPCSPGMRVFAAKEQPAGITKLILGAFFLLAVVFAVVFTVVHMFGAVKEEREGISDGRGGTFSTRNVKYDPQFTDKLLNTKVKVVNK